MGEGDAARTLLETTERPLNFTRRALLHVGLGQVTEALTLFKRGAEHLELDALELYRGFRHFVEDRGLRSDLDAAFQTPRSHGMTDR
jgi:hypothetical protein